MSNWMKLGLRLVFVAFLSSTFSSGDGVAKACTCEEACLSERDACIEDCEPLPNPTCVTLCIKAYQRCLRDCNL